MTKARAIASTLLAAALAAGLSGCGFMGGEFLPHTYDASDGVSADLGDVDVRNAMVIAEDGRGSLVASLVNTASTSRSVSIQFDSSASSATAGRETLKISVPARSTITLGYGDSDQLVLEGITAEPGDLFEVYFQSGDAEGTELPVPVLDGTLTEYSELLPSPSPTPTPTPTPTLVPTPAPTPTDGTVPGDGDSGETGPGDSVTSGEDDTAE